jgi:hypothetical protein
MNHPEGARTNLRSLLACPFTNALSSTPFFFALLLIFSPFRSLLSPRSMLLFLSSPPESCGSGKERTDDACLELITATVLLLVVTAALVVIAVVSASTTTSATEATGATTAEATTAAATLLLGRTLASLQHLAAWGRHVIRAGAAILLHDVELDFLAYVQRLEAAGDDLECGEVDEVLLLVDIVLDEAEAAAGHPRDDLTLNGHEQSGGGAESTSALRSEHASGERKHCVFPLIKLVGFKKY